MFTPILTIKLLNIYALGHALCHAPGHALGHAPGHALCHAPARLAANIASSGRAAAVTE
jgi:hypothetical protein